MTNKTNNNIYKANLNKSDRQANIVKHRVSALAIFMKKNVIFKSKQKFDLILTCIVKMQNIIIEML